MSRWALTCVAAGILAAAGAGGWFLFGRGAVASTVESAAQGRRAGDGEMHEVALFSYVDPAPGDERRSSMPVMLTLDIRGRDGLGAFCSARPRLKEAVLRVFEDSAAIPNRHGRKRGLDRFSEPLKAAMNRIVAGAPVAHVRTSLLWDAIVGGAAAYRTDDMCRDFT